MHTVSVEVRASPASSHFLTIILDWMLWFFFLIPFLMMTTNMILARWRVMAVLAYIYGLTPEFDFYHGEYSTLFFTLPISCFLVESWSQKDSGWICSVCGDVGYYVDRTKLRHHHISHTYSFRFAWSIHPLCFWAFSFIHPHHLFLVLVTAWIGAGWSSHAN